MLNNIILEGWVLNNPEVVAKSTITGSSLVKFMLHNVCRGDGTTLDNMILPIQSWGEFGEKVLNNVTEGMLVRIVGRLMKCTIETPQGDTNPLMTEEWKIGQWKLVFSTLLDTHNVRFVQVGGDFYLFELWVDDKKLLETHFPHYCV